MHSCLRFSESYLIQWRQNEAIFALVVMFESVVKFWWWEWTAWGKIMSYLSNIEILRLVNIAVRWHNNSIRKHVFIKYKRQFLIFAFYCSRSAAWSVVTSWMTFGCEKTTGTKTCGKWWLLNEAHKVPVYDNSICSIYTVMANIRQHCTAHLCAVSANTNNVSKAIWQKDASQGWIFHGGKAYVTMASQEQYSWLQQLCRCRYWFFCCICHNSNSQCLSMGQTTPKIAPSPWRSGPPSMGRPKSPTQKASWSIHPLLQGSKCDQQTDRLLSYSVFDFLFFHYFSFLGRALD